MEFLSIFLVIVFLVMLVYFSMPRVTIKSHWQHFFDNQAISSEDFYSQIKAGLKERKIDVSVTHPKIVQGHVLSAWRTYLRISEKEMIFYTCAAPFGTGTFVSWWHCETVEGFMNRIPVLSKLIGKDRKNKTFYQMDTEAMYKSAIHTTILSVVEEIGKTTGMRELNTFEKQYKAYAK